MLSCVEVQVSVKLMGICTVSLNFNWTKNLLGTSTSILVIFMVNVICGIEWISFVLRRLNLIEEICNFKGVFWGLVMARCIFNLPSQHIYFIFTLVINITIPNVISSEAVLQKSCILTFYLGAVLLETGEENRKYLPCQI